LLNALHCLKKESISLQALAEEACDLEIDRLGKPIGKQDQYMAAFGGLRVLEISKEGNVHIRSASLEDSAIDDLNRNLLMYYTHTSRSADKILFEQSKGAEEDKKHIIESMHFIKEIGYKILEAVETGNITEVGLLFDQHWIYKKRISAEMSNPRFDEIYETAKQNGALGGKISGAGGGGFFIFYVEENHGRFREAMKQLGLREMRYRFDLEGTKVLVNLTDGVR
jgi:D-glycero-alpha-D-manno-heptose-7-phosphate kinase